MRVRLRGLMMNSLSTYKKASAEVLLGHGMSIRKVARIVGAHRDTIMRFRRNIINLDQEILDFITTRNNNNTNVSSGSKKDNT